MVAVFLWPGARDDARCLERCRLRYKTHRVVDDGYEIITAVETTTGAVDEASQFLDLIEAHEDTT